MNDQRARALARRQQELLVRSAELRLHLATDLNRWHAPLALADKTRRQTTEAWHWLRAHPEVPLAGAAALLLLRPRHVLRFCWRWGSRLLLAKRLYKRYGRVLAARI